MSKKNNYMDDFEIIDYDEEEKVKKQKKKKKKKRKRSLLEKLIISIEGIVALLFACVIILYATPNMTSLMLNSKIGQAFLNSSFGEKFLGSMMDEESYNNILDTDYNSDNITTNEELDLSILDGYMNIAMFGLDNGSAEGRPEGGSDCIMILSINKNTSDVKVVSIYRDTYLKIINENGKTDHIYPFFKVNYAYNAGGAQGAVNTLNANLDLNIKDYVSVNFNGIANIIDLLGGIEVNLTEDEMNYVNGYLTETRIVTGMDAPDLTQYGENIHLTGLQATAYSRIRYAAYYEEDGSSLTNDYGRAARQRNVIMKMVAKAKSAGLENVLAMADEIFNADEQIFKTSIPYDDVLKLIPIVLNFSFGETSAFPYTMMSDDEAGVSLVSGSTIIPGGLDYNVIQLHNYLFPEEVYSPSSTVSDISEDIYYETGVRTIRVEDFSGQ